MCQTDLLASNACLFTYFKHACMIRTLEPKEQVISGVWVCASVPHNHKNLPKHAALQQFFAGWHAPYLHAGLEQGGAALVAAAASPGWWGCASPAVVLSAAAAPHLSIAGLNSSETWNKYQRTCSHKNQWVFSPLRRITPPNVKFRKSDSWCTGAHKMMRCSRRQ